MQKKLIGSLFILIVLLIIGSTSEKVQASPTSSNGWQLKWAIKNNDFEDVDIEDYGVDAGTTNVWQVNQKGVEAWEQLIQLGILKYGKMVMDTMCLLFLETILLN